MERTLEMIPPILFLTSIFLLKGVSNAETMLVHLKDHDFISRKSSALSFLKIRVARKSPKYGKISGYFGPSAVSQFQLGNHYDVKVVTQFRVLQMCCALDCTK